MKSWRTWWGRRESDSPVELSDLFIYFGQKTIEELKSEDIVPLPVHGFVSQKLFIHLISPSTPSANKCKQIHNTTGVLYCCHPPWQNHSCIFLCVCVCFTPSQNIQLPCMRQCSAFSYRKRWSEAGASKQCWQYRRVWSGPKWSHVKVKKGRWRRLMW